MPGFHAFVESCEELNQEIATQLESIAACKNRQKKKVVTIGIEMAHQFIKASHRTLHKYLETDHNLITFTDNPEFEVIEEAKQPPEANIPSDVTDRLSGDGNSEPTFSRLAEATSVKMPETQKAPKKKGKKKGKM